MSAKDNFAQAMKELLNTGEPDKKDAEDKKPAPSGFSSFSQPENRPPKAPAPEKKESMFGGSPAPADAPKDDIEPEAAEEVVEEVAETVAEAPASVFAGGPLPSSVAAEAEAAAEPAAEQSSVFSSPSSFGSYNTSVETPKAEEAGFTGEDAADAVAEEEERDAALLDNLAETVAIREENAAEEKKMNDTPVRQPLTHPAPSAQPVAVVREEVIGAPALATGGGDVTVIAPGTVIVGDVNTSGGLVMNGDVKGNMKVAGKMELNGKVIGDIEAEDAEIVGSLIRGNIKVKNVITVDGNTTVVGDISAQNSKVNGKIKGNITVEERGHFEPSATLVGNLVSGTVIIDEGAMLKGDIAITNAQNENIAVDEPEFDIEIDI